MVYNSILIEIATLMSSFHFALPRALQARALSPARSVSFHVIWTCIIIRVLCPSYTHKYVAFRKLSKNLADAPPPPKSFRTCFVCVVTTHRAFPLRLVALASVLLVICHLSLY